MPEERIDGELLDLLRLTMIPGVGPLTSRALLGHFRSPGKVLSAPIADLKRVDGVGPKLAEAIRRAREESDPEVERERCRQAGVALIPFGHDEYPAALEEIPDPPLLLYRRGDRVAGDDRAIAIVGARKSSPYGIRVAERLAGSLARAGVTVVSGLARGIDAAAHRGALKAGGRTIAVLGNGLGSIYPPEHDKLADQVAERGALYSEQPMTQEPLGGLFPQRNRIISGLVLGVLVVEATPRSGSLTTATHAMEQNREVFAVPGPIDSLGSRGCHALIRDGARLVESVEDILEELPALRGRDAEGPGGAGGDAPPTGPDSTLSEPERAVLGGLDDIPRGVDEIIGRTGLAPSQVVSTLAMLEVRRLIRRSPGNQFVRL